MILVTGASGNIGSKLVSALSKKGVPVRAFVRNAQKTQFPDGVQVALGNYADPSTLDAALVGIDRVFLMGPTPLIVEHVGIFVEAMRRADVQRAVLLSSLSVEMDHGNAAREEHEAAENLVKTLGDRWTILRAGELASNALRWAGSIRSERLVRSFVRNDPCARVDPFDVAAVAAEALTGEGHEGQIYALTGGEATTPRQCTEIISKLLGIDIAFVEMTDDEAERAWVEMFGDRPETRGLIRTLREENLPWYPVRQTVEQLLRRKPRTFSDWAKENLGTFSE